MCKTVSFRFSKTVSFRFKKGNAEHKAFAQLFLEFEREKAGYTKRRATKGAADDSPLCPECQCELHLTTAGEHVCRNETCPNYR